MSSPSKRKRKSLPEVSPKLTVQERKSRFKAVQEKYRNQRCQKETREKLKMKRDKKPKASPDEDEESIASLLKRISADINTMKVDLKENNQKIDSVNDKIKDIEVNAEKATKANKLQFEMINGKVARMETTITDRVIEKIDPQIKTLKNDLRQDLNVDLRNLVKEEIALRFPEKADGDNGEDETTEDEDVEINIGEPAKKKKKKIK